MKKHKLTQSQKLGALLDKAVDNGFKSSRLTSATAWQTLLRDYSLEEIDYFELIFNHDFAKALWGDNPKIWETDDSYLDNDDPSDNGFIWNWQYHLQQAVIAEDPIVYMYWAVFGDTTYGIPEGRDIL